MIVHCPHCGGMVSVGGLGRKKLNIPVTNIIGTIKQHSTITAAANSLGCSRGYLYKVLKDHGLSAK